MVVGYTSSVKAKRFEDWASAKIALRTRCQQLNEFILGRTQTGTAGNVEFEEKGGQTIVDASLAVQTWVAQISAYAEDVVVTITWENAAEDQIISTITLTDANETAFTVPIVTGYKATACNIDVPNPGGVTVKVGVTGMANPVATIQAASSIAAAADLHGAGDLYIWEEANTAADVGKEVSGEYVNILKLKKYFIGTLQADTTTIDRCLEATYVNGVLTVSTTPVTDFLRRGIWTKFEQVAGKYIALGSEVQDIYTIIEEGIDVSLHSRYMVPSSGYTAYLIGAKSWANTAAIAISVTYTEFGSEVAKTLPLSAIPATSLKVEDYPCVQLQPGTEVKFEILGNTSVLTMYTYILELKNPKSN